MSCTWTMTPRRGTPRSEDEIEPRLGKDGDLYAIQGWGSKLAGAVARLAGVLHMARYGPDGLDRPVSSDTMAAAVALGRYFIPHTKAAFTIMGADQRLAVARRILAWAARHKKTRFKERDCWLGVRRQGEEPDIIRKPLALLCEYGWLRPVNEADKDDSPTHASEPSKGGRPPLPTYQVNPLPPTRQDDTGDGDGLEGSEGSERPSRTEENSQHTANSAIFSDGVRPQNAQNPPNAANAPRSTEDSERAGQPDDPWDDKEEEGDLVI